MTLKGLDPRAPRLGRLRLGEKDDDGNPVKSPTWILTSHDEERIQVAATKYGGVAEEWEGAPEEGQWKVKTEASVIPVLLPPDPLSGTPIYEQWGSGGCKRRCDGETATVSVVVGEGRDRHGEMREEPCTCSIRGWQPGDADDMKKGACDLVMRVNVVLPDIPGIGCWQVVTGSVFAAKEIPGQIGMLRALSGDPEAYLPASVAIEQRRMKKPWESFTRNFPVPVLRTGSLSDMGATGPRALGAGEPVDMGESMPLQSHVSMACKEAGLDDTGRHWLIWVVTAGRVRSSREVTPEEAKAVEAAARRIKDGWVRLELITGAWPDGEIARAELVETAKANSDDGEEMADDFDRASIKGAYDGLVASAQETFTTWWKGQNIPKPTDPRLTKAQALSMFDQLQRLERDAKAAADVGDTGLPFGEAS